MTIQIYIYLHPDLFKIVLLLDFILLKFKIFKTLHCLANFN